MLARRFKLWLWKCQSFSLFAIVSFCKSPFQKKCWKKKYFLSEYFVFFTTLLPISHSTTWTIVLNHFLSPECEDRRSQFSFYQYKCSSTSKKHPNDHDSHQLHYDLHGDQGQLRHSLGQRWLAPRRLRSHQHWQGHDDKKKRKTMQMMMIMKHWHWVRWSSWLTLRTVG